MYCTRLIFNYKYGTTFHVVTAGCHSVLNNRIFVCCHVRVKNTFVVMERAQCRMAKGTIYCASLGTAVLCKVGDWCGRKHRQLTSMASA